MSICLNSMKGSKKKPEDMNIFGLPSPRIPVTNEGLVLKMVHTPGSDWNPGWGGSSNEYFIPVLGSCITWVAEILSKNPIYPMDLDLVLGALFKFP